VSDTEWYGQPHTLTVHSVRLPEGKSDDGDLGDDPERMRRAADNLEKANRGVGVMEPAEVTP